MKFISNEKTNSDALGWRPVDTKQTSLKTYGETKFSLSSRLKSFTYAFNGLTLMIRTEHNCWIHLAATVLVLFCATALQISLADWRWIIFAISIVWITEAINTALECLCDVISPNLNPGIKAAKDIAAGAVLISSITAVFIGLLTMAPYMKTTIFSFANNDIFLCKAFQ